jgi:hypothetical protein
MSHSSDGNDRSNDDPSTNVYRIDYDPASERPSLAVVSAVAEITGRDVIDLPLLQDTLSPECLDDLFAPTEAGSPRDDGRVEFPYHDFRVTVYSHGRIEIRAVD